MRHTKTNLTLLVFIIGLTFHPAVKAQETQFHVPQSVLSSGSEALSNSSFRVVGTLGQTLIGVVSNLAHIHHVGFWYQTIDLVTSVEQIPSETIPTEFRLEQNYPNPFNPTTTIEFALPRRSQVTLKLFDLLGRMD
ncbi:MAG: hypothetical protein ACE5NG_13790 [bacterium]